MGRAVGAVISIEVSTRILQRPRPWWFLRERAATPRLPYCSSANKQFPHAGELHSGAIGRKYLMLNSGGVVIVSSSILNDYK